MRIVFVCRVYPTHRPGGMPFVVQDRAEALVHLGHDVHVITTGRPASGVEFLNKVQIHYTQSKPVEYSQDFAQECEAYVKSLKPKVLHLDGLDVNRPWWTNVGSDISAKALTLHGFGMGGFLTKWNLYREGIEHFKLDFNAEKMAHEARVIRETFDTVIGISKHEEWMLRDCYGCKNTKLVYNPIAPYFFDENTAPATDGAPFLCAAISGQGERGFRNAEIAAQKCGRRIRTVNDIVRSKMPYVYDECAATVIPTAYAQGFDLTVAESLSRLRPIIASSVGSYLRDAETFAPYIKLVPLGDVDALAAAMRETPPVVTSDAALRFRPDFHAHAWLSAVWPWGE